ncbi:MAG: ABC transporter permease [Phycicoccus sp.]|nr:ABC transporter permease [Phycicoccus sp.]
MIPRTLSWSSRHMLLVVFAGLVLGLAVIVPSFRETANLVNIVEQQSIIGIVACGMLLMILLGGFDLSVGAVGAASSVVGAWVMAALGIVVGVAIALIVGVIIGLCNGVIIARYGVNPFVATLGMQSVVVGLLFVATDAIPVYGVPAEFLSFGLGRIGPVPVAALVFGGAALFVGMLLKYTVLGHHIYAVGGSREASRLAGIPVVRTTVMVYVIGAALAALAGLVLLGQTSIGQPGAAATWPLSAIAAVAIAGVPLTGGRGSVGPVVLGTVLLGTIANGLNLFGVSPYWQPAITGAVILVAVALDVRHRRSGDST